MNTLMLSAAVRWVVNVVVVFLLGHSLINPADQGSWTTTLTQFVYGLISVSMLLWTIVQNRWPNLVHVTSNLPQVDKVALNRGVVMNDAMKDNPSVVVSVNSQRVGG